MNSKFEIKIFGNIKIRTKWDPEIEDYYFSVVDVIEVLSESKNPNRYWSDLKRKLKKEGSEILNEVENMKMLSPDNKFYRTDVVTSEPLFRIIQSVPSPNAEPLKLWLAKLGRERLDEIANPELISQRRRNTYKEKGYSDKWIDQREKTIEVRNELTDEWNRSGVKEGIEHAMLTDEVSKSWSGLTTREYKNLKNLKKENLRDNMTNTELVLNMLAEVSTTKISKKENPKGFDESKPIAKRGGGVAAGARGILEKELGESVISTDNAKNPKLLDK
ncbi:BRO family protein [uncultured Methanobrevibacter sp.]|uniref:BRO family protein n=1 Tax=uncultured Methanobrevibacter sp. TaxID=253161 RepID=UPI002613AC92|nr:BRO family protein [uncultured Methanobrevibacter sp.]